MKIIKLFLWFSNRYTCSVLSVICIWPRRVDHHGIRCILLHASFTSLIALEHLHWYWDGGDQYIYLVARLPFLAFGGVDYHNLVLLYRVFYYVYFIYNIWYELNENYYCEIVHASVCSLSLCIIIIIHWAILAQPTFLLFFFSFRLLIFCC